MQIQSKSYSPEYRNALHLILQEFIQESTIGVTYSASIIDKLIYCVLADEDSELFIVFDKDVPCGMSCVARDAMWHPEAFGYITKFYVRKEYRGTGVARLLIHSSSRWFDDKQCCKSFISDTAMIQKNKALGNLCAKFGYRFGGELYVRNNNE